MTGHDHDYTSLDAERYVSERAMCWRVVRRALALASKTNGKRGEMWRGYGVTVGVSCRVFVTAEIKDGDVVVSLTDGSTTDCDAKSYGHGMSPAEIVGILAPDIRKLAALPWPRELSA